MGNEDILVERLGVSVSAAGAPALRGMVDEEKQWLNVITELDGLGNKRPYTIHTFFTPY